MAVDPQVPDRRPLLFGVVAVAILLTAAVLFWPTAREGDPDTLMLTPESLRVSSQQTPAEEQPAEAEGVGEEIATEDPQLPETPLPHGETRIVDASGSELLDSATTETAAKSAPTPKPLESASASRPPTPKADSTEPASDGPYVLNVGSFQGRANADQMVMELKAKGIPAHVRAATVDGATVYRVRVGYFESSTRASAYARTKLREQDLDAWAGPR